MTTEHIEEHCNTDKCPRCAAVYAMLQLFRIQQSPLRYSELFQLVEHTVELEEAITEYRLHHVPGYLAVKAVDLDVDSFNKCVVMEKR